MSEEDRQKLLRLRGILEPQKEDMILADAPTPKRRPMTEAEERLLTAVMDRYTDLQYFSKKDWLYEEVRAVAQERADIAAGDRLPGGCAMCKVRCQDVMEGPGPGEKVVKVQTPEGWEEVIAPVSSVKQGFLITSAVLDRRDGKVLVELPRESASGRWRLWIDQANTDGA